MAFFGITEEIIEKVWEHPNADRLDLAKVYGMDFQFVVGKDSYKEGDKVLYFPIDSILPPDVIEKLGLTGRLAGKDHNRVKTVKLRGEVSQGIVCRPETVLGNDREKWPYLNAEHLTDFLGVTKYDPPPEYTPTGILRPLPEGVGVYDIEEADRYTDVAASMLDEPVQITEKLEGTNTAIVREPDGTILYCQRENRIEELEDGKPNLYAETARAQGVPKLMEELAEQFPGQHITLRGEVIGYKVQGNIYQINGNEIRFFDLQINHRYVDAEQFASLIPENHRVPVLAEGVTLREWLDGKTIQQASNGKSVLNPKTRREGIVVKPMRGRSEEFEGYIHRCIIKQRSPEYLAKGK